MAGAGSRHDGQSMPCKEISDKIEGHAGVTSLTVLGLTRNSDQVHLWYNPTCVWDNVDVVYSPTEEDAALLGKWKKKAKIVVIGPNVYMRNTHQGLVDAWIEPSEWVKENFQMRKLDSDPDLQVLAWPVGVDELFWTPNSGPVSKQAVIYLKTQTRTSGVVLEAAKVLAELGYKITFIQYGSYDKQSYLSALQNASIMVVFSFTESQGIFMFEAWSCNVPTFHYIGGSFHHDYDGYRWFSHPAPYLTARTGALFDSPKMLREILLTAKKYRPRMWILESGTAKKAGEKIVKDMKQLLIKKKKS
jgi:hypothetical protein